MQTYTRKETPPPSQSTKTNGLAMNRCAIDIDNKRIKNIVQMGEEVT